MRSPGRRGFSTSAQPVSVPPVPTPEMMTSTLPPVSRQISSAVVSPVDLGVRRVGELLQHDGARRVGDDLLGGRHGARHAARRRREHDLGAQQRQHLAPLDRHAFRHGQDQAIAARRADERQRDPGVAGRGLDQRRARADPPLLFGREHHREADPVLDRRERVEELTLAQKIGMHAGIGGELAEPDQRRFADGIEDAVVDAPATHGRRRSGDGRLVVHLYNLIYNRLARE